MADTHLPRGTRRLPERCVHELERADVVLHAGDVVTAAVLDELRAFGPLEAVHGNMDDAELRATLPKTLVVEVEQVRIGLVHIPGPRAGRSARLVARFPGCDAVVYGHTHVAEVAREGGVWILNPGSPTERRRSPGHSMIVLSVRGQTLAPELIPLGDLTGRTSVR